MSKQITIPVFHEDETESFLKLLKEKYNVDITKCYICETPIVKTERSPRGLLEKIKARRGKKFWDWNIGGISRKGVICESLRCIFEASIQERDSQLKE